MVQLDFSLNEKCGNPQNNKNEEKKKKSRLEKMQKKIRYASITVLDASHYSVNLNKCSQQSSRGKKCLSSHINSHPLKIHIARASLAGPCH